MTTKNKVFIATSIDGFIADKDKGIDWLHSIANPEGLDMGYEAFMNGIDALVMGRHTFETVCRFEMDWPYTKPVFVLSSNIRKIPKDYREKAQLVSGSLQAVNKSIHDQGYLNLYIDGGKTIQSFLKEDLIDEIIISTIPVILGGGIPLFSELKNTLNFELVSSTIYLDQVVQTHLKRKY